jgi:predicted Zn-dependent peptidase
LSTALFAGHRLAKPITGAASDVQRLRGDRLVAFRDRQWSPAAGIGAIIGNLEHLDQPAVRQALQSIPERPLPPQPVSLPPFAPRTEFEQRDSDVVHLRLVYSVPGIDFNLRRDRAVAEVFSQLVGGPMGSRLFDELREQRALCYWVDGYSWAIDGAAFLSVSCSVHPSDLAETYEQIGLILSNLRAHGPTDEEARRFRAYTTGTAALDFESAGHLVDHAIDLVLEYNDFDIEPQSHLQGLQSVTRADLSGLAANIDPTPCIGCVGPVAPGDLG